MGWVELKLRCPEKVNGLKIDPEPDWSFKSLLAELNELESKQNASARPFVKSGFRELPHARRQAVSKNAFVMQVSDTELDDSDEEDGQIENRSLVPAGRFTCNDMSSSEGEDSEDDYAMTIQIPSLEKMGLVEGAVLELNHEFQLGIKEEIRNHISELENQLLIVNEKSTAALLQVQKKADARREMDRKLDMHYQRKIAEALDDHLTTVVRDHEHKSQMEERRIRDDAAALEESRKREKAIQEEKLRQQKLKAEEARKAEEVRKAALEAEESTVKEAAEKLAYETSVKAAAAAAAAEAAKLDKTNAAVDIQNLQLREAGPNGSSIARGRSAGNLVRAAVNALKLEEERKQKYDGVMAQKPTSKDFLSFERQIARQIRTVSAVADNISKKAIDIVRVFNNPSCPQSVSVITFAKKVISLCETPGADFNHKAFACGYLIVLVTSQFPYAMDILLAEFHRTCIYTVPKHIMYSESAFEKREDYFKAIGFHEEDGKLESEDQFLQRLGSCMKLYGALVQTEWRGYQNLHGLEEGWAWLARALNSLPVTVNTVVAVASFLRMAGFALHRRYKSQFLKLLAVINQKFVEVIKTREDHKVIFKGLLDYIETKEYLKEPEGRQLKESLLSNYAGQNLMQGY